MGEQTGISWADSTANLWVGCQKVSPACDHCYAEDLMGTQGLRFRRVEWGPHDERQRTKSGWADVRKWNARAAVNGGIDPDLGRRRRVFVNSLSDFFDNHPSVVWRDEAWDLIRASPHVIFMLVTKRPQLIARYLPPFWDQIAERVWLLTTVENQTEADRRVPALLDACAGRARAAVLGVSCEPLLGPINLRPWVGWVGGDPDTGGYEQCFHRPARRLDWVIAGGESGREARPMHTGWLRSLRDQCALAAVAFHLKQWGEWVGALGDIGMFAHCQNGQTVATGRNTRDLGDGYLAQRVGKARAGRELDGREHLEFPCAE